MYSRVKRNRRKVKRDMYGMPINEESQGEGSESSPGNSHLGVTCPCLCVSILDGIAGQKKLDSVSLFLLTFTVIGNFNSLFLVKCFVSGIIVWYIPKYKNTWFVRP